MQRLKSYFQSGTPFICVSILLFIPVLLLYLCLGHIDSILWVNNVLTSDIGDTFFKHYTELGNTWWFVALVPLFFFFRKRNEAWIALISMALMGIMVNVSKRLIFNSWKRPKAVLENLDINIPHLIADFDYHSSFTFPSGHTSSAYAMFFFLAVAINNRYWSWAFAALAFFIAFSRVYLFQHFINDVFAGAIVGILSVFLAIQLLQALQQIRLSYSKGKGFTLSTKKTREESLSS